MSTSDAEWALAQVFADGSYDRERATKLFPNQGLHTAAAAFAGAHERAVQYLEQAPVLVLGAMAGGPHVRRTNVLYIQHKIVPLCERGAKLADVLKAFGLATPLRKLRASALFPTAGPVVQALSAMDPAVIGRIVPEKPAAQRRWLSGLQAWRDHMARRAGSPDRMFAWAAEALSLAGSPKEVTAVADYARNPDNHFNEAWGWPRADEEATRWHTRLTVERVLASSPISPTTVIDLGGHPDQVEVRGFDFVALRTPLDLAEEGAAMQHCVGTYINDVMRGGCHIVGIRIGERRVATLEIRNGAVRQLKGKRNSEPAQDVAPAAADYVVALRRSAKPKRRA